MGRSSVTELLVMREQEACTKDDKKLILSLLAPQNPNAYKLIYIHTQNEENLGKFRKIFRFMVINTFSAH